MRPLCRLALLLGCAALGGTSSHGELNCPCIDSWASDEYVEGGQLQVELAGETFHYPLSYGLITCDAWDNTLPPYCAGLPANSTRPAWCSDPWCYVDKTNCDIIASKSQYFPDLHYSYMTCGSSNTFENWFIFNEGDHVLTDLVDLVADYLKPIVREAERRDANLRLEAGDCSIDSSCPCATCSPNSIWGSSITFQHMTTTLRPGASYAGQEGDIDRCLASTFSEGFQRVAAKEANTSRIGYLYAGLQELGTYLQWPGIDWCPSSYDPRFRNWYAAAVAGPKDVVIVIDVSGSMETGSRIQMARDAAVAVVDTLTEADYVTAIVFSSSAESYSSQLRRATIEERAAIVSWIERKVYAGGSTNFHAAFDDAWRALAAAPSSGCNRLVLFLSDGEPTEWNGDSYAEVSRRATELGGVHLFTYALGNGANEAVLKQLACENEGIFQAVPDDGNLKDAMSAYFQLLAPLLRPCTVRWIEYVDWFSQKPLLAGCLPAFRKLGGVEADSSCDGGLASLGEDGDGRVAQLMGTVCTDMSLIVDMATLQAQPEWPQFWAQIEADMASCPRVAVSEAQMETLRLAVSPQSSCGSGYTSAEDDVLGGVPLLVVLLAAVGGALVFCSLCTLARRLATRRRTPPTASAPTSTTGRGSGFAHAQPVAAQPVAGGPPVVVTATAVPVVAEGGVAMGIPVQGQRY